MPIGLGAALLIGSAVSAGTQIVGAKMQSGAAKDAAKAQQAAADRAIEEQKAARAQAQAAYAPYQQMGQQGINSMGQMLGARPQAFNPNQPLQMQQFQAPRPMGGGPQGGQAPPQDPNAMFAGNAAMGRLAPQQQPTYGQMMTPPRRRQ